MMERQCKALGQLRRLKILSYIKKHRRVSVRDLTEALRCTWPAASQHLRVLREAGIVMRERQGPYVFYFLVREQSAIVRTVLGML